MRHNHGLTSRASHIRRCRGVALIWVVITFIVLLGLVGLALDTARVLLTAHELQNAADAAALAGAQYVRTDTVQARTAVMNIAAANYAGGVSVTVPDNPTNDAAGSLVLGRYDRETATFTPTLSAPNAVKVIASRTAGQNGSLPLIFGPLFNATSSNVQRQAIAMAGGGTGAGLIALSPTGPGLTMNGTINLDVDEGAVVIDAASSPITANGASGTVTADSFKVVAASTNFGPPNYSGPIYTGSNYVPDPLASLTAPSTTGMTTISGQVSVKNNDNVTISPGYYTGGIKMTGGNLTLNPGVYVFDQDVDVNGGNFTANGVMIYMKSHKLKLAGNGSISITPLAAMAAPYAIYEGISIFQARDNTNEATIGGNNSTTTIGGTLYFPNNLISLQGTGDLVAGNQLIANQVAISGTGTITIHYDGRNPAAGNRVYLVE